MLWLVFACSTAPIDRKRKISKTDFKPVALVQYNSKNDHYHFEDDLKSAIIAETVKGSSFEDIDQDENHWAHLAGLCYRKKFDQAQRVFRELYARYKKNSTYWNLRGVCEIVKANFNLAILYLNKSLDYSKDYAPAMNNLGIIFQRIGQSSKAMVAFEKAISFSPRSNIPMINASKLYLSFSQARLALRLLEIVYKRHPKDDLLKNLMAQSYLMLGDYSKAKSYYQSIEDDDLFESPSFGLNYSVALHYTGEKEEAREIFSEIENIGVKIDKKYYNEVKDLLAKK
jgi:tetratricopeptide (TPR) repeat protein